MKFISPLTAVMGLGQFLMQHTWGSPAPQATPNSSQVTCTYVCWQGTEEDPSGPQVSCGPHAMPFVGFPSPCVCTASSGYVFLPEARFTIIAFSDLIQHCHMFSMQSPNPRNIRGGLPRRWHYYQQLQPQPQQLQPQPQQY
jgi:hypothetical protein